ncbi:hypothetical protein D3C76_624280 [compost metagenome]
MENEKFYLKTINYSNENFLIKYFENLSSERVRNFIEDTKRLIIGPKTVMSNIDLQQTFHVMLIIKHFTDYPIHDNSIKELKEQAVSMFTSGLFNKIVENLDMSLVVKINDYVLMHSILTRGEAPNYLSSKNYDLKRQVQNGFKEDSVNYETYTFKELIQKSSPKKKQNNKKVVTPSIDQLLDELLDYKRMHDQWKNIEYLIRIEHIKKVLKGEEFYCEI